MKKISTMLLSALLLAWCSLATAEQPKPLPTEDCKLLLPYGAPKLKQNSNRYVPICRTAYTLVSDLQAKIPAWVAYTLTPEHTLGCIERTDAFAADLSLPEGKRAELSDYKATSKTYDRGHLAPDGDMSWDAEVERESFLLSNMAPQAHHLNRGIWEQLESYVRTWADGRQHKLLIYDGPVYDLRKDETIGENKVVVADRFYKIVIDTETKEVLAFLFPKEGATDSVLAAQQHKVSEIQKLTGIKFPLPKGVKSSAGTMALWPGDPASFKRKKKAHCAKAE